MYIIYCADATYLFFFDHSVFSVYTAYIKYTCHMWKNGSNYIYTKQMLQNSLAQTMIYGNHFVYLPLASYIVWLIMGLINRKKPMIQVCR